ncbi:MAG: gamma-glutamyltransferase [Alphaproteobacteria bacterium]|nr:gamma-glutamyltransferase [Alphaproteobacteria bacterium]MBU1516415.1 gamma-glutamyltransferase [Alphaproteobacteria bacterium]MBU2093348.1 gamma-glutamyltransferase [Alphaproteobacteria bacterium]MBU2153835.1 gamma-glutamyltransferase [Alphaproteobacteria bacterium]MBU2307707.1 gamma-glutamyltransferase [Alphaproteobacteria bacterium]
MRGTASKVLAGALASVLALSGVAAAAPAKPAPRYDYILDYDAIHHPVIGRKGMVVSQNAVASKVGAAILARGGNAVDAAVATALALSVTLPQAGNLGGGGFALIYIARERRTVALDYYPQAPGATTRDLLRGEDGKLDPAKRYSHLGIGVPGTILGLREMHLRYGKLPWRAVAQPAVDLAAKGIVVTDELVYGLGLQRDGLTADAPTRRSLFRPDGGIYRPGETIRQPDLAWSLTQVRDHGSDAFYHGELGRRVVAGVQAGGGVLSQEDLAAYRVRWSDPVVCDYRGVRVAYAPPPSAGVLLCELMNILERFPMAEYGQNSVQGLHVTAEAMKLVFADRARFMGGYPQYAPPAKGLTSKAYAATRAALIDPNRAMSADAMPGDPLLFESRDTTHFAVADAEGNVVTNTYTLGSSYGAHVMAPGTGFFLNDAMANFNWSGDEPANQPEPGKRVVTTITPLIAFRDGKPWLASGSPGGTRIISAMAQLLVNVIDHRLNIAEATARPRIFQAASDTPVEFEPGFSPDVLRLMAGRGHKTRTSLTMGSTQSIVIEDGVMYGGADTRRPDAQAVAVE